MSEFNGLNMSLGNLSRLSRAKTRSISAENFTGEKGKAGMATEGTGKVVARELGQGWKISPSIHIEPRQVVTLADIAGRLLLQRLVPALQRELAPDRREPRGRLQLLLGDAVSQERAHHDREPL